MLLLLALALVAAPPARGRDICVSPAGRSGGDGTAQRPMPTLAAALAVAGRGDIVRLAAGLYREGEIRLRRGGAPGRPLEIRAEPGAPAVISGATVVTGWRPVGGGVWRRDGWATDSQQLFCDGAPLAQIGAANPFTTADGGDGHPCLPPRDGSPATLPPGSFCFDSRARALYCRLPADAAPGRHALEASTADFLLDGGDATDVVLRGLTFRHSNGTAAGARAALVRVGGSGWLVEDCEFAAGDFAGVAVAGERHVFRRCRFAANGCLGVDVNGSDAAHGNERYAARPPQNLLFDADRIEANNYRGFYEHWHAGGIKLVPGVRGATLRGCAVLDNRGPGIWFDASLGANAVEDCLVARNAVGIAYEIGRPAAGDAVGLLVRNNRIADNREQGLYVSASSGAVVEHNTFYRNGWDVVLHGMPRTGASLAHNRVRDNVLLGRDADAIVYVGEGASDNTLGGNVYARGGGRVRVGAVAGGGYDARYNDLPSLRAAAPELGASGESRAVEWADPEALDFRIVAPADVRAKGWQPPPGK